MHKASIGVKIGVVAAFLVSFTALAWISTLPHFSLADRIGGLCALLTTIGGVVLSWGLMVAYVGKRRGWSLKSYRFAGLALLAPGLVFYFLGGMRESFLTLLICLPAFATSACQKVAFPHLTLSEIIEQRGFENEPLSLFPK